MADAPKSTAEQIFGEDPTREIFEKEGLTRGKLARFFIEKMGAKETKFFQHQGKITARRNVNAHDIQLRAGIEAAKMVGMYPAAKIDATVTLNDLGQKLEEARKRVLASRDE